MTVSKNFKIGVHLTGYKLIWFKLGVMIGTTDTSLADLDLGSGHIDARKQIPLRQIPHKVQNGLDGICSAVETCLFDELHTHFISSYQVSREKG